MARTLGFALGVLMLFNAATYSISPEFGWRLWNRYLRRHVPDWLNQDVDEYSRLSHSALRYVAVWELLVATVMLWLASRARD